MKIDGIEVELTNQDKVLFPHEGITKGDLIDYYSWIAPYILPHISGRPVTMLRYPDGIYGKSFYHKDVADRFPSWFHVVNVSKKDGQVVHAVCEKKADLVYLANMACITPHVWLSREGSLDRPDRMILDMDPAEDQNFEVVKDAAVLAAKLIREIGLEPYVMTTGSRGLHVTVPLDRSATFKEVLVLARAVSNRMMEQDERFTTVRSKVGRKGRLLVDLFRNAYAQTGVAPYAVRARDGAPVATPLEWRELDDPSLRPWSFNVLNMQARLANKEPWKDIELSARSPIEAIARLNG